VRRLLLAALAACAVPAAAAEKMVLTGAVAYTDVMRYDYSGDGKRKPVRFWMEFDGHSATGTPGQPGYQPAAGTMRYFLRDADNDTKVLKWRGGLDMAGAPRDTPVPMTDLRFDGKTVQFEAFGMQWTIVDGGEGYASDRISVNDGFRRSDVKKLYAGDIWVGPAK
jgi:hypothetical protein